MLTSNTKCHVCVHLQVTVSLSVCVCVGKEDGKTCKRVAIRTTIRKDDCRSNAPVSVKEHYEHYYSLFCSVLLSMKYSRIDCNSSSGVFTVNIIYLYFSLQVTVYSCDGKCPSATIFNFNINSHARFCKCCRENSLQNRIIQLYCTRNATTVDYYYQEPMDCSCQWN